jgi:hypothetical protein
MESQNQNVQDSINIIRRFVRFLKKRLDNLRKQEKEFYENYVCTFCGNLMIDCGGDHGDEMRDICRESRSRHY